MAKKNGSTELTAPGTTGLAAILGTPESALDQRPDFIPSGDKTGTEGITRDDLRVPRIAIAQAMSPEVISREDRIDDLRPLMMFNTATRRVYGEGPIYFIAVRRDVRGIQFRPRAEGGGIIDMNVPVVSRGGRYVDPRLNFTGAGVDRKPPVATVFEEFVSLLLLEGGEMEPIVISIKKTNKYNRKALMTLNGFIKMHASRAEKSVPIYGVIYSLKVGEGKNDKGTWGVPVFEQHGFLPPNEKGKLMYQRAVDYWNEIKDREIVVDREPGDDDDFIDGEAVEETSRPKM